MISKNPDDHYNMAIKYLDEIRNSGVDAMEEEEISEFILTIQMIRDNFSIKNLVKEVGV